MRRGVGLLAAAMFVLTACGGQDEPGADQKAKPTNQAASAERGVRFADSELGKILVDQSGRTLYGFTKDKDKDSNCDADCIAVWPAFTAPKTIKIGAGTDEKLVGSTEASGTNHVTYGEWPLYYYVGDTGPGDVSGQGVDAEWFVIAPDGKLIKKDG